MNRKILTVAVPAYNVEKYIEECLGSFILPDSGADGLYEVLVINDGSRDATERLARGFEERYPSVFRVINKENGGHGSAINTGVKRAAGKYFKVVDGDDCVDTGAFAEYLRLLSGTDADLVATGFCCCDAETMEPRSRRSPVISGGHPDGEYLFDEISGDLLVRMHSAAWKTSLLRDNGIRIDERSYYVDMEYIMFPVPYTGTVLLSDKVVYKYRLGLGGQSVSLAGMRAHAADHERILGKILEYIGSVAEDSSSRTVSPAKIGYMEKIAAEMVASQHQIYLSYPAGEGKKAESARLDNMLKTEYPGVYGANRNKAVSALRLSGYALFSLAGTAVRLLKK